MKNHGINSGATRLCLIAALVFTFALAACSNPASSNGGGEEGPYTITYLPGANGTGSIAAGSKTHDIPFTLSSLTFSRANYTQTGWSTIDGGAKVYDLGGIYSANASITLYPFWTENGGGDDWIAIENAAELYAVRNKLSGKYYLAATFSLADPEYSDGEGWEPIGTRAAPFTGIIEGRGYNITGLKINSGSKPGDFNGYGIGLFGSVSGAEITDLVLEDVDITVTVPDDNYSNRYVGAITGFAASNSVISGCSCTGTLSVSSYSTAGMYVGGIAGELDTGTLVKDSANKLSSLHTVCYATGTVSPFTGGIAGYVHLAKINGSYSTGTISGEGGTISYVGGIAGALSGSGSAVSSSHSTGNISADGYAGGIAARTSSDAWPINITITDCYSTGDISAESVSGMAGGIVADARADADHPITITGCYSTGTIKSSASTDSGSVLPSATAGGIVGNLSNGTISACYSMGNILVNSVHLGNNPASAAGGGIAGTLYSGAYTASVIKDCYSQGNINVAVTTSVGGTSGTCYAGGIAGNMQNGEATNCYARGAVSANCSSPVPYAYSGGIAGFIGVDNGFSKINSCAIINPVIMSVVSNDSATSYVGRIVGFERNVDQTTISDNFALDYDDALLHIVGNTTNAHIGVLKTAAELKTQSTYADPVASGGLGWNFGTSDDSPWKMGAEYPELYWQ